MLLLDSQAYVSNITDQVLFNFLYGVIVYQSSGFTNDSDFESIDIGCSETAAIDSA